MFAQGLTQRVVLQSQLTKIFTHRPRKPRLIVTVGDIVEEQKTGATMIRKHVIRASLLRATLMVGAIAWGSAIATDPAMARNGVAAQPVVPDWSGVYFGAYVGGGFGRNPWNDPDGVGLGTTSLSGAIFSVAVGYNWQIGNVVLGIEGSGGLSTISGDFTARNWNFATRIPGIESAVGRVGFTPGPGANTLLYVKGGAAWAQYKDTSVWPEIGTNFENKRTLGGWTAGAGYAYRFAPNMAITFEYNHYNFGSGRVDLIPDKPDVRPFNVGISNWQINSFSVGFNYQLGGASAAQFPPVR